MNKQWWKESVVYQVYPRSFQDSNGDGIGDLPGILQRLDYIKELGADVIWLCPIYRSPNDDNGYDISDYQNIMEEFGTMADFDRLLEEAHKRGLKLVLDLVVNHTSDEHKWFIESRKSQDNPYRDYYIWKEGKAGGPPTNWGSCFGGSAWKYDEATDRYFLHLFSPKQPDLNWENPQVRDSVYEMMTWWLDKGIDGFRMDVISMISKNPDYPDGEAGPNGYSDFTPFAAHGPHVHEYLQEMNRRVLSLYDIMTVGETAAVTIEEARRYAGNDTHELNMVFQFELVDLDHGPYGKWNDNPFQLSEIKEVLTKWQKGLEGKAWNSLYWSNHDQPRVVSRFGNDSPAYRERCAKMLGTCLHMMQGTPYIYQGEELGMTNVRFESLSDYRDIETLNAYQDLTGRGVPPETVMRYLYKSSRDNARTPMQWDASENAGFTSGTPWIKVNPNYTRINAAAQVGDPDSIFHYYQKLIALRKRYEVIVYGAYELLLKDHPQLYVYTRTMDDQRLLVLCNFTQEEAAFSLPEPFRSEDCRLLLSNYSACGKEADFTVRPYEARVYYRKG